MTQAPTPGPLSGTFNVEEYVADYEFRADEGSYSPTENERALLIDAIHGALSEASLSLAPTAPVEASGSEREVLDRVRQMIVDCEADPEGPLMLSSSVAAEHARDLRTLLNPRPQPSGETREAVARLVKDAIEHRVYAKDGRVVGIDLAVDDIAQSLSALPLALGGQQGEGKRAAIMREVKSYAGRKDVGSAWWVNALTGRIMEVTK